MEIYFPISLIMRIISLLLFFVVISSIAVNMFLKNKILKILEFCGYAWKVFPFIKYFDVSGDCEYFQDVSGKFFTYFSQFV